MKISLVQVASPAQEPVERRRERVAGMVADAAQADLVVLPELWPGGYFAFGQYENVAEPLDGDTVLAAREWAKRHGIFLHMGSFVERTAGGRLHNTALLIDPSGGIVHAYRKMHVFGYQSHEAELLTPGSGVSVTGTSFGAVGATTCYDLRFPETYRALVDAGAEVVIVPAAWPAQRRDHWRLFTSCRAVEEQVLLIACNAAGNQVGVDLGGHSRVVDPWGAVLVEAGVGEGISTCDVDPAIVERVRAEFPVLADRLPSKAVTL